MTPLTPYYWKKDCDTWWKAFGNQIGSLSNGIDNRVQAINTTQFIKKEEVPIGHTVTYANFVCNSTKIRTIHIQTNSEW